MKVETGVMIMKDGKAWGKTYEDGRETCYGWMNPEDAPIYNPEHLKKPEDATWKGSHHVEQLKEGQLINVKRVTMIEFWIDKEVINE